MARTSVLVLIVASVALVPLAIAQDASAPTPSGTNATLYAHHNDDGSNDNEYAGWMNTLASDKDSDDIAMGDGAQCTTGVVAIPVVEPDLDLTWSMPYAPALTAPIALTPGAKITVTVYIGASGGGGTGTISTKLVSGTTTVFESEEIDHTWPAATGEYAKATWELEPAVDTIPVGELNWTVHLSSGPCDAEGGPFLGVDPQRGTSNMVLPIAGGASTTPTLEYHELSGPTAEASLNVSSPTNATHQYNWTASTGDATFTYAANLTNGTIRFRVIDAGDSSPVDEDLLETGNGTATIKDATPGNWSVIVDLASFSGDFQFALAPAAGTPSTSEPASSSDGTTTSSNASGGPAASGSDKDTPGPGLLAVGCTLAAVAIAAWRRRAP